MQNGLSRNYGYLNDSRNLEDSHNNSDLDRIYVKCINMC